MSATPEEPGQGATPSLAGQAVAGTLAPSAPAFLATPAMKGIALKVLATLLFAIMNTMVKAIPEIPPGEVAFARALFALPPILLFAALTPGGVARCWRTKRPLLHVRRSLTGTVGMFFYFTSLTALPLVDATAIGFAMPIFVVILAALFLKEHVGLYRWSAVLAGFLGVVFILAPHFGDHGPVLGLSVGAAAGLAGALAAGFVVVFIRDMSRTESSESIVFYFMLTGTFASSLTFFFDARVPNLAESALLVAIGIAGGLAQLSMTFSYRFAEPSLLAPFDYTGLVWATLLGFALFGEVPVPMVVGGVLIVVGAGLFIAWRERVRATAKPAIPSA
ncbi:MAG: DMT family transporter [Alphaproteobacteria bacterium]|nr:DMT family transporter [Alphaproteobacteria bacterium]